MLIIPRYPQLPSAARGRWPLLSACMLVVSTLLMAGEWWWPSLPPLLQDFWLALAGGRLYSDPDQAFFGLHQVWTHVFYHQGWWQTLPLLVMVGIFASLAERLLGSVRWLVVLLAVLPISASVHLMLAAPAPEYGLSVVVAIALGVCLQRQPGLRMHWQCWYATHRHLAWTTLKTSWLVPVLLWLGFEGFRQGIQAQVGWVVLAAMPLTLFLTASAAASLSAALEQMGRASGLRALANGQRSLDKLETVLADDPLIDFAVVEQVAQRCIAEAHLPAARQLATYVALRDPQHPCYGRLRTYLEQHPRPQDSDKRDAIPPSGEQGPN